MLVPEMLLDFDSSGLGPWLMDTRRVRLLRMDAMVYIRAVLTKTIHLCGKRNSKESKWAAMEPSSWFNSTSCVRERPGVWKVSPEQGPSKTVRADQLCHVR